MIEVAVVGGGPAGSYCAYTLAENEFQPTIFDHSHPREKPCGGLVTPLTQEMFPFLLGLPIDHSERDRIYFISPNGKQNCVRSRKHKVRCFSRLELDQFLVNMAVKKGAELIKEKVIALRRNANFWEIKTTDKSYCAKTLIGADGVNSLVRKNTIGSFNKKDLGFCFGYFVRGLEKEEITIRFLSQRKGYMWAIPRKDHTCVGIGSFELFSSRGFKRELDVFIEQNYPNIERISEWAFLIPNVKDLKTFHTSLAGRNWIIIGDAAGHVDPINGEGIMYALLDGELAAQAIVDNDPRLFDNLWREVYGRNLFAHIRLRKWFYNRQVLELYCQFLKFRNWLRF
jgi:geranylgeranyl reductase family protein